MGFIKLGLLGVRVWDRSISWVVFGGVGGGCDKLILEVHENLRGQDPHEWYADFIGT